jgi:hypothetical protein
MRNKFTELIQQGVAKFDYTPIAPDVPEQDQICRMYNNVWSIALDTHMHLDNETGIRYITGHNVGIRDKWEKMLCATNWGGMTFKASGAWSLCDFLQKMGLKGDFTVLNNDVVYACVPYNYDDETDCDCPTCCVTTESQIPQRLSILTIDGLTARIAECYEGKKNLYEVSEALNKSLYVKGNNWTVNEGKLVCPIGNKVYVL